MRKQGQEDVTGGEKDGQPVRIARGSAAWKWLLLLLVVALTALCWLVIPMFFTGIQSVEPYRPYPKTVLDLAHGTRAPWIAYLAHAISSLNVVRYIVFCSLTSLLFPVVLRGGSQLLIRVCLMILYIDIVMLCTLVCGVLSLLV